MSWQEVQQQAGEAVKSGRLPTVQLEEAPDHGQVSLFADGKFYELVFGPDMDTGSYVARVDGERFVRLMVPMQQVEVKRPSGGSSFFYYRTSRARAVELAESKISALCMVGSDIVAVRSDYI